MPRRPPLPVFLERRSSDEYAPPARTPREARAVRRFVAAGEEAARRGGVSFGAWASGRRGTAAGLLALNAEAGRDFCRVPDEAAEDEAAAAEGSAAASW
jgi:hypothetical protein